MESGGKEWRERARDGKVGKRYGRGGKEKGREGKGKKRREEEEGMEGKGREGKGKWNGAIWRIIIYLKTLQITEPFSVL